VTAVLVLTGCGSSEPRRVPDVRGQRLDVAERHLLDRGLDIDEIGGGALGVVVRSNWTVCAQEPPPGRRATTVRLIVDRSCPAPTEPPVPAGGPPVMPSVLGESLEDAKERLDVLGISYDAVNREDPDDEPLVDRLWTVCDQAPEPGAASTQVTLYVEHFCDD
jgi:beta-lactam-binding protein with PASTA domain